MTVTHLNNIILLFCVCKINKMLICVVNFNFISANDNDNCYLICFFLYLIYKQVYIQIKEKRGTGQHCLQQISIAKKERRADTVGRCSTQFQNLTHKLVHNYVLIMATHQLAYSPEESLQPLQNRLIRKDSVTKQRLSLLYCSWWDLYRGN